MEITKIKVGIIKVVQDQPIIIQNILMESITVKNMPINTLSMVILKL